METLNELKVLCTKIYKYKELIETPFYTASVKTNIQKLKMEIQRSYSRLEDVITRYGGIAFIDDPTRDNKENVFEVSFDTINPLNYTKILRAIDKALKTINKAIGKLEAEQDRNTKIIDWEKGIINEDVMGKLDKAFRPFDGKREETRRRSKIRDNEKNHKSIMLEKLLRKFISMKNSTKPQKRGYELERLLCELFELFKLSPSKPFKITGEQIDGSFTLENIDFLIEAQWEKIKPTAEELYGFQGKVNRKLQGTKGLFISIEGFTSTSIQAFEKGTTPNILLMDGEDLLYVLEERIDMVELLSEKKKHASRTGEIFYKARVFFGETI